MRDEVNNMKNVTEEFSQAITTLIAEAEGGNRPIEKAVIEMTDVFLKLMELARKEGKESAAYYALCPLDGRYSKIASKFSAYFSEYALVKYRVSVEVSWLHYLIGNVKHETLNSVSTEEFIAIDEIASKFNEKAFKEVKKIESETRHDVKSVEKYVAKKLVEIGLEKLVSFVHIGCTSEDINNLAYGMMIRDALKKVWVPTAEALITGIVELGEKYKKISMLAHTHGQPATPTKLGKELIVFASRLDQSLQNIISYPIKGKFNGATGTYAAISVVFPNEDWPKLAKEFVEDQAYGIGLTFNPLTTQIENQDYISHILDGIGHFVTVLEGFDLDMWLYIALEYFNQIPVEKEVGSSTMPHKINPIRFENSEGNAVICEALAHAISRKSSKSRMQRDLSGSTVMRNVGLVFGYSLQSIEETLNGLTKVSANELKLAFELDNKWAVLAEPIQQMLRKYGVPDAYDKLKELTRGKEISKVDIRNFIESLDFLTSEDKEVLLNLCPNNYTGRAEELVDNYLNS